jgi:hypothetical protein
MRGRFDTTIGSGNALDSECGVMQQPTITFIVNDKTYRLCATDSHAMRELPVADRQQLITLLEALKQQDILARQAVEQAVTRAKAGPTTAAGKSNTGTQPQQPTVKPERLGSGDVDALMARLVMEDKLSQKPGLTQQGMYKVIAWAVAVIIALIVIF